MAKSARKGTGLQNCAGFVWMLWLACKGKGRRERKGRGGALSSCDALCGGSG